jgi:hypothetical protein
MTDDEKLWQEYVSAYNKYVNASLSFHNYAKDKLACIKSALEGDDYHSIDTAFHAMKSLNPEQLCEVFDKLVSFVSYWNRLNHLAEKFILSIERQWVIENIERYAEPILATADEEIYSALLSLYIMLDVELTRRLALRALQSDQEDIREAGQDALDTLEK